MEQLYTSHPALYDAIQSEWDYDRDVSFIRKLLGERAPEDCRLLEVGCGTGEHTKRFVEAGFDTVGIDPNAGMLERARAKTTAQFDHGGIPDLPVSGEFDVIVAIRGVINHLRPDDLSAALAAMVDHLSTDGYLVFDNSPLPPTGNHPALEVGTAEKGHYARIVQMNPTADGQLQWDQVVFTPDGEFFIDTYPLTPFEDLDIATALNELNVTFDPVDGYGPDDRRTVFVCTPSA